MSILIITIPAEGEFPRGVQRKVENLVIKGKK